MLRLGLKKDHKVSLQESIDDNYAKEEVDDPNNLFRGHSKWWKKESVDDEPESLVLQLKRFDEFGQKIDQPVKLPQKGVLDFSKVLIANDHKEYRLIAFIRHSGNVGGGHYVAHIYRDGKWYLYNDKRVCRIGLQANEGNDKFQNYIMICERL